MNEQTDEQGESAIDARLSIALGRMDRQLTAQEIAVVRSRIERQEASLRRLRAVPLANGDEPASAFEPPPSRRLEVSTP